jgi:hypothetical protein
MQPQNHACRFDEIFKTKLQASGAQIPKPCNLKNAGDSKSDPWSRAYKLFTVNKLLDRPAGHQPYRNCVRLTSRSFQFGRTSTRPPPHWPHFARHRNDGTSASFAQRDTSISAEARHASFKKPRSLRCTVP